MARAILQFLPAVLLGVFVRYWRGFSMLDPFFLIPFSCLSVMLVPRRTGVVMAVVRACGAMFVIILTALIALNLPWEGTLLLPEWQVGLDAALLSIATATAAAALNALFLSPLKPTTARWIVRAVFLAILLVWQYTPVPWSNAVVEKVMDWGLSTTALGLAVFLALLDIALLRRVYRSAARYCAPAA